MPTTSKRVLLVWTPWATPVFPAMSVALLRSILMRQGMECDLLYANLIFSKMMEGDPLYEQQVAVGPIADATFMPTYFGTDPGHAAQLLHRYVAPYNEGRRGAQLSVYQDLVAIAGRFVERVAAMVPWERYDIVGFSLMFQQTLCALSLAKRIRQTAPHVKIVFGGPCCDGSTGEELVRSFPEVDYVVQGEADETVADVVREIRSNSGGPFRTPGILYRSREGIASSGLAPIPRSLEANPIPDYAPYFQQLESLQLRHFHPRLYVETARGCWWGEKHHCSFCGMDDRVMRYRAKTADRVLDEVVSLARRHRISTFLTSDSVLGHQYYESLLPRLRDLREKQGYDFTFFYELKSNLPRERARLLREAGILQVQPGIESFSDRILSLMNKGATGIQQLQALKFLAEYGVRALWNMIYMVPQERPEDYDQIVEMIPFMHHLPPPSRKGEIQVLVQRGNRYHAQPEAHEVRNVRPMSYYAELFPRKDIDLNRLAIFFEYDHPGRHEDSPEHAAHERMKQALAEWRRAFTPDSLVHLRGPGFVEIKDTRDPGQPRTITLRGVEAELYARCDAARREATLAAEFAPRMGTEGFAATLDRLVRDRVFYRSPRREYISLPLTPDPDRWNRIAPRIVEA
jgi:ribosomal peptide maturation radical SAM protein 1